MIFAGFCFLSYYLSHTLNTQDTKILKLISGTSLLFLGVLTLNLQYYMPNSVSLTTVTDISESAQVAVAFMFMIWGCYNIYLGVTDIGWFGPVNRGDE